MNVGLRRRNHQLRVFGVASGATSKVGLMLLSLGVSQVGTFIGMQCQAQSAFKRPQMISENVRILEGVRIKSVWGKMRGYAPSLDQLSPARVS